MKKMIRQARKYVLIPEDRYKRMVNILQNETRNDDVVTNNVDNNSISFVNEETSNLENKQKSIEDILSYFPIKMKSRARLISSFINKDNSTLSWNSNGELINNGEVIKGSSLTDLLYDACCPRRKHEPVGASIFYKALKSNNLPEGIIHNKDRHKFFQKGELEKKEKNNLHNNIFSNWKKY